MYSGGSTSAAKSQLLALFRGPLQGCPSSIVYCTMQALTEEVAKVLYAQGITAVAYHAGKPIKVGQFSVRFVWVGCLFLIVQKQ